jgi:hypothetical protein
MSALSFDRYLGRMTIHQAEAFFRRHGPGPYPAGSQPALELLEKFKMVRT